jgi:hypothetical protein
MSSEDARRRRRSSWPVRVSRLDEDHDDVAGTTPEQRLTMMWELATQAWAMAGRALPDYDRAHTPVSVRLRGEDAE